MTSFFWGVNCVQVVAETFHREYLPTWSKSFYRPRDVELKNIGLVNVQPSDSLFVVGSMNVFIVF